MKSLPLLLLATAFAVAQTASAQDAAALRRARQAAAARRAALQAPQRLNQGAFRQHRYIEPVNRRSLLSPSQTNSAIPPRHKLNGLMLPNPQSQINNSMVTGGNQNPVNTNSTSVRMAPNPQSQVNTNTVPGGSQSLVNTDSSTSVSDRQNRGGAWQGDRSRWNQSINWDRTPRDRDWWRTHYTRFALFGGGYYYWNGGYWYPAYGYDPYFNTYAYEGPIYAHNDEDPGQVIASVQAAVQRRGYDPGGVDGDYGPMTRRALLDFQRDNDLPVTGQIDRPTRESLGFR